MTRALPLAPPVASRRKNRPAMHRTLRGPERILQVETGTALFACPCGRLTERERGRCAWCEWQGKR